MFASCIVSEKESLDKGLVRLVLDAPAFAAAAKPGQFVMLKSWQGLEPYLARPISLNRIEPDTGRIGLVIRVKGTGTDLLARCEPGDVIQVHGPLGSSFPVLADAGRVALVGRGVGAAPLRTLAEAYAARGCQISVYLSARNERLLLDREVYKALGASVTVSTDPLHKVTEDLDEDCRRMTFDAVYCCGSMRLAEDIRRLQKQYRFEAYISLEARMACGVGACKSCVCRDMAAADETRYICICSEGPVLPLERVIQ